MSSTAAISGDLPGSATVAKGLSSQEAERRREQYGWNEPAKAKRGATALDLLFLFLNPLVIILLVASLASLLLGDATDAVVIFVIVLLGVLINFVQTYRSQQAIDRLREKVTPTATALRDGKWAEIPRREIVPGDVVRICAGDLIPADGELLEARDLLRAASRADGRIDAGGEVR